MYVFFPSICYCKCKHVLHTDDRLCFARCRNTRTTSSVLVRRERTTKKSSKKQHFEPQIRLIELNTHIHTQHMHAQKLRVDFSHRQAMAASQTCIMYHLIAIFGYISLSAHIFFASCCWRLTLTLSVFNDLFHLGILRHLEQHTYTSQRCLSLTADSLADMMRKLLRTGSMFYAEQL